MIIQPFTGGKSGGSSGVNIGDPTDVSGLLKGADGKIAAAADGTDYITKSYVDTSLVNKPDFGNSTITHKKVMLSNDLFIVLTVTGGSVLWASPILPNNGDSGADHCLLPITIFNSNASKSADIVITQNAIGAKLCYVDVDGLHLTESKTGVAFTVPSRTIVTIIGLAYSL